MKITFGGTRGTRPLHDKRFARFGGATTSVLVRGAAGETIIIDCGSGLANLEAEVLASQDPVLILFTHLHLDHMMGLPSFQPLHQEGRQITLAGCVQTAAACQGLFSKPYWPLSLDSLPADIKYLKVNPIEPGQEKSPSAEDTLSWGQFRIRCLPIAHPGGCLAYRLEEISTGHGFLFATDCEWGRMNQDHRDRFQAFATQPENPQVLAMDGHFTEQEYTQRQGWGHSTQEDVVGIGQSLGCEHILITHHSPDNDDEELERRRHRVQELDAKADLIAQGLIVDLT